MTRLRYSVPACVALLLLVLAPTLRAAEAPPLMLATVWDQSADPTGWWMSEKFDGVRGYWDGARMLTRQGEAIAIPAALAAALPDFALDGELWLARGRFEATVAVVRDRAPGPGWSKIRYLVFDAPQTAGVFEARMARVAAWLADHPSELVQAVAQVQCEGRAHLQAFLAEVEGRGGEGVMLRAPRSAFVAGRSDTLRKYKSFDDTEATVVGYNPGRGKYAGRVGSLRLELPDGTYFAVGTGLSDAQRRDPPPLGSLVTFRHHGWTARGLPRFPVFWRVRELPARR
jgi:DNA ligase-1